MRKGKGLIIVVNRILEVLIRLLTSSLVVLDMSKMYFVGVSGKVVGYNNFM